MNPMENIVQNFEKLSINAIPAKRIVFYHGWIVQLDKGYKDRANSVYPLYISDLPKEHMVEYCENLNSRYNIRPRFKVTEYSHPLDLDYYLNSLGYKKYSETSFQTLDLSNYPVTSLSSNFFSSNELSPSWFEYYCTWNSIPEEQQSIVRDIWERVSVGFSFCQLKHQKRTVCIGFMVQIDNICGIFGITTDPNERRQGHGKRFMVQFLSFATLKNNKTCFLQVETANIPAIELYTKLGFEEQYRYWYRKKK